MEKGSFPLSALSCFCIHECRRVSSNQFKKNIEDTENLFSIQFHEKSPLIVRVCLRVCDGNGAREVTSQQPNPFWLLEMYLHLMPVLVK